MVASTASEYPLANFGISQTQQHGGKHDKQETGHSDEILGTEEEKALIEEKMKLLPTQRYGAYLRKMAIDGYIIYTDTADIKDMNKALSAIGRNINQIAKRLNAGSTAYEADIRELKERLDEIWQLQRRILLNQP